MIDYGYAWLRNLLAVFITWGNNYCIASAAVCVKFCQSANLFHRLQALHWRIFLSAWIVLTCAIVCVAFRAFVRACVYGR